MKKIYLIIYRQDVDLYCGLRGGGDFVAYYFDPTLADYIALKGAESFNYIGRVSDFSPSFMQTKSRRCAVDFEIKINEVVKKYTVISNVVGWQHLTLRYFFLTYFWYSELWAEVAYKIPEGEVNIFVNNNPHYLNQNSYLPSVILMQHLSSIGRLYKAFLYGEVDYKVSDVLDVMGNVLEQECDLLVHLPTIIHDAKYIATELAGVNSIVNIKSKYWDTNTNNASIDINAVCTGNADFHNAGNLKEALALEIDELLSSYFSAHEFRRRQVKLLVDTLMSQVTNYFILDHYFSKNKPKKLLISDHDAGLHGPILQYCDKQEIEIFVFPHSKFILDNGFNTRKTIYLNHSVQRSITSINSGAKPKSNLYFPIEKKLISTIVKSNNKKTIGLILNGLSEGGVLNINFESYLSGIKILGAWCCLNSVIMKIRCRPDMPIRNFLSNLFFENENIIIESFENGLDEFIADIDLCIMYDIPTSASISILNSKCPLINIMPVELDFWISGWIDEDVVPVYSVPDGVAKLSGLLSTLDIFLENQQAEYNRRIGKSQGLKAIMFESRAW